MNSNRLNRNTHRWSSIIIALPFLVIIITGILLLLKKEFEYIQPASAKVDNNYPTLSFDKILSAAQSVEIAEVDSWQAIDRLDVRPNKGIVKVRTKSSWEIQLDAQTGQVLKVAFRRSDIIEKLHDFTYWQDSANLWFTLPVSITLVIIAITGIILFFLPYYRRHKNKQRQF